MQVGITGGSGFIGRHLVRECLSRGHHVKVLSRKGVHSATGVTVCLGDLTDPRSDLEPFVQGLDILYHCAGEIRDESLMRGLHVEGTKRLVEAAVGKIGRWVQLSSVGTYGKKRSGIIDEATPVSPFGVYESTKTESDLMVVNVADRSGMDYAILKPSNVFGIDMPNQSLIGMIKMLRKGFFFYVGRRGAVMNYVHISSVIRALMLCGEHNTAPGNTYILSDHVTIEEMVSAFAQGMGIAAPTLRIPEKLVRALVTTFQILPGIPLSTSRVDAMTGRARYNSSKIERDLVYKEEIPLIRHFEEISGSWASSF